MTRSNGQGFGSTGDAIASKRRSSEETELLAAGISLRGEMRKEFNCFIASYSGEQILTFS